MNAASRQALMQKLARIEPTPKLQPVYVILDLCHLIVLTVIHDSNKPNIPQTMQSRSVLLKNMFNPEEWVASFRCFVHSWVFRETGPDWDRDLGDEVKGECEDRYGKVDAIKVEKDSQVRTRTSFGHPCFSKTR